MGMYEKEREKESGVKKRIEGRMGMKKRIIEGEREEGEEGLKRRTMWLRERSRWKRVKIEGRNRGRGG